MEGKFIQQDFADIHNFVFVDEKLIEQADGVRKNFYQIEKYEKNPIIKTDRLWESYLPEFDCGYVYDPFYSSIVYNIEKEKYICYYQVFGRFGSYLCLAESSDGINWIKPELNQVFFNGSFENNIIKFLKYPALSIDFGCVVPNYSNEIDAEIVCSNFSKFDDKIYFQGITVAFSKDGINWNFHFPPVLPYDGDAHCLMWDPVEKCYLITTRSYQQYNVYSRLGMKRKRHIAISKSRDLIHWTPMVTILEPDEKDPENREFYKMFILPYGHGYIGFLQIFDVDPSLSRGPLEVQLTFSRDLIHWDRVGDRKPFIPRGEKDQWDSGMTLMTICPVAEGKELRFWYGGKEGEHWVASKGGIGTGKIGRDRFISWKTDSEGYIITCPLHISGIPEIFVNIKAPDGYVQVEILEDNKVISGCERENCIPVSGNHILAPIRFKNPLLRLSGDVRLKFYLKKAEIFSFKGNLTLPKKI
ncbi:MAG: hypothetical protein NC827_01310 [Candidatus Omnitrophica bacterium]|nr:hypothetical protein [Candidatus Omnitrophota bacterium]MCM8801938.1 hypothetical protein [Candidatus Omnitrophota bacterium]